MTRKRTGRDFNCEVCGTEFYRPKCQIDKGNTITCSRACWSVWRRQGETRSCSHCGSDFYARKSQISQGYANYCSRECFGEARKKREEFECVICADAFERRPWQVLNGYTKVCSSACMQVWRRGKREGTTDRLFTVWQKQEWKDGECARCGSSDHLELDHIVPRFAGGEPVEENAQTLCRTCNRQKYHSEDRFKFRDIGKPTQL